MAKNIKGITVCSYCCKYMGEVELQPDNSGVYVSHGLCDDCHELFDKMVEGDRLAEARFNKLVARGKVIMHKFGQELEALHKAGKPWNAGLARKILERLSRGA